MPNTDRRLITSLAFRAMARRGATRGDLADVAILKAGGLRLKAPAGASANREVGFILSTAAIDREGDTLAVNGWDDADFNATGGPVLWAHDHSQLTIAKSGKPYVAGANYCAVGSFTPPDLNPFGDTVYRMLTAPAPGPYLNACSVGFQPREFEMSDTGVDFSAMSLIEWSVCPVPANPQAIVIARSKGIDTRPLQRWAEHALDLYRATGDAAAKQRDEINLLRIQSDPKGRKFFSVLASLKLPGKDAASDAAERETYQQMQSILASVGTNCSMAVDAVAVLLGTPEPSGTAGETDEEAADQEQLTLVVTNCQSASDALASVVTLASPMLTAPPKAQSTTMGKAGRASLARVVADLKTIRPHAKAGRVLSAANEAALRRAVAELEAVLGQLDADDGMALVVDDVPLPDVDDGEDVLAHLTERDITDLIARVIADEFCKVTGRVD